MKVILVKQIASLGNHGDIKEVAEGYARNFLIPRGLAQPFEEKLVQNIKEQKEKESQKIKKKICHDEKWVSVIQGKTFLFRARANEQGHLFAHIGVRQIVETLFASQIDVSEKYIFIDEAIKSIGCFKIYYRPSKNFEAIFFLQVLAIK